MNAALIPALIAAVASSAGLAVSLYIARTNRRHADRVERLKWVRETIAADVIWIRRWLGSTTIEKGVEPENLLECYGRLLSIQALFDTDLGHAAEALRVTLALGSTV